MKTTDILESLSQVDKKYISDSAEEEAGRIFERKSKSAVIGRIAAVAALAALAVFASFIAISKRNDRVTASMIDRNSGLSHSFTKEEFNKSSYTQKGGDDGETKVTVPVCDIESPGDGETVWGEDYVIDGGSRLLTVDRDYSIKYNEKEKKSWLIKTKDGVEIYRVERTPLFTDRGMSWWKELNGGLLVAQYKTMGTVEEETEASFALMFLNEDGTERWRTKYLNPVGTHPEQLLQAYYDDGKIYIVSVITEDERRPVQDEEGYRESYTGNELCHGFAVTVYDEKTGEMISRNSSEASIETQMLCVHCIGMTGQGFVITLSPEDLHDEKYYVLLGYDGKLGSICRYNANYEFYSASSIGDQIYLSGKYTSYTEYTAPIGRELFSAIPHAYSNFYNNTDYYKPDSKLTKEYKEQMSAALLVCDGTLTPVKVYRQNGSYGGELRADGERLLWDVCEITAAYNNAGGDTKTLRSATKTFEINGKGTLISSAPSDASYVMLSYQTATANK